MSESKNQMTKELFIERASRMSELFGMSYEEAYEEDDRIMEAYQFLRDNIIPLYKQVVNHCALVNKSIKALMENNPETAKAMFAVFDPMIFTTISYDLSNPFMLLLKRFPDESMEDLYEKYEEAKRSGLFEQDDQLNEWSKALPEMDEKFSEKHGCSLSGPVYGTLSGTQDVLSYALNSMMSRMDEHGNRYLSKEGSIIARAFKTAIEELGGDVRLPTSGKGGTLGDDAMKKILDALTKGFGGKS